MSGTIALPVLFALALVLPQTWQQVDHSVWTEDEGAEPYVQFVTESDTFFGYANTADAECRGGTFEDLLGVLRNDDDTARIRFVPGYEELCPSGTYICIDPDQGGVSDEPTDLGFCGSIRLERSDSE